MKKTLIFCLSMALFVTLLSLNLMAQEDDSKSQLYSIHEDFVKPSMVGEYENAIKEFKSKLAEHGVDLTYMMMARDDFHYLHIKAIDNFAQLDENTLAGLEEKMGEEAMQAMWSNFDGCYDVHMNYLIRLSHDLSYNDTGITAMETPYRQIEYYYVQPGKGQEARAIAKEWHDLYGSKEITSGYRVYTGAIGTEMPVYIIVQWAENPAELQAQVAKNEMMLGDDGKELQGRTLAITRKMESHSGWMRPDLSHIPAAMTAK